MSETMSAPEAAYNADGESYRDMWLASTSNVARVAAKANRYREALQEIVASDSPLGRNGVPSHKEIARRALAAHSVDAGTFACPICGKETPHYHSPAEVEEHRATEAWVDESWNRFQAEHATLLAARSAK